MRRTAVIDRTSVVRVFGIGFLALMLALVWLTYAVFTKRFSSDVAVTVVSQDVGLALSRNADVKLRGVIVGRVSAITTDGSDAQIHLALDPELAATIPAQVKAYIIPKTLFGEKYVELRPVSSAGGAAITAGARIEQGAVPAEVERLLDDVYPLLTAVQPEKLSYLLTALSDAFGGQGANLGNTLTSLEEYLVKLAPLSDDIVRDVKALGRVSETYGSAMPEIGDLLDNAVVTADTVVAKQTQIQQLFASVTSLSHTADDFLRQNGDNLITLAVESQPTLDLLASYSPTLPCILGGIEGLLPRLDDAFRDQRAHVSIEFSPRSPSGYAAGETVTQPGLAAGLAAGLTPDCRSLPRPPYDGDHPAPGAPASLLSEFGIADHRSPSAAPSGKTSARLALPGSQAERSAVDALVGGATGIPAADVPDLASQLALPALRGAAVSVQ
jgi:phospholipid/cholesterol/gamma-HCH transport system substrate-binding protein